MTKFSFGATDVNVPDLAPDETQVVGTTTTGVKATADGISIRIDTPFGLDGESTSYAAGPFPVFGFSETAWRSASRTALGGDGTAVFSIIGLTPAAQYNIKIAGKESQPERDTRYTFPSGTFDYDATDGTEPPNAPVSTTETADVNGEIEVTVQKTPTGQIYGFVNVLSVESAVPAPTITDINTTNEVTPGATATLTGTNLTNATGVNIGSVSQTGFSVVSDTSVTFTGTRGGNPYNQDLTATLLSPDGDATITVQQVPEAGTFAVTAASPNTTDDASLWSGLIDTSTSNPVTVVDGDQAWVNTTLDGLAIAPNGTITANETGTFTVQFWRALEGVWGSDQTVSFTLPEAAEDNWPYHKNIRYRSEQTWTWGSRHPKTGMRVRIFNE